MELVGFNGEWAGQKQAALALTSPPAATMPFVPRLSQPAPSSGSWELVRSGQAQAALALAQIARNNAANQAAIVAVGGIQPLLELLKTRSVSCIEAGELALGNWLATPPTALRSSRPAPSTCRGTTCSRRWRCEIKAQAAVKLGNRQRRSHLYHHRQGRRYRAACRELDKRLDHQESGLLRCVNLARYDAGRTAIAHAGGVAPLAKYVTSAAAGGQEAAALLARGRNLAHKKPHHRCDRRSARRRGQREQSRAIRQAMTIFAGGSSKKRAAVAKASGGCRKRPRLLSQALSWLAAMKHRTTLKIAPQLQRRDRSVAAAATAVARRWSRGRWRCSPVVTLTTASQLRPGEGDSRGRRGACARPLLAVMPPTALLSPRGSWRLRRSGDGRDRVGAQGGRGGDGDLYSRQARTTASRSPRLGSVLLFRSWLGCGCGCCRCRHRARRGQRRRTRNFLRAVGVIRSRRRSYMIAFEAMTAYQAQEPRDYCRRARRA